MSPKICADAQNCALRYSADEGVVRPRGSILGYYLFVHNCSASYLRKCSEPKEFYLLLHFCVFLVLFRLLAHVRATRTWTTHFSHLERFPFSQNFRFVIPENFQFKWKGLFRPRNRASFWVLHLTFHWLIADEAQQNKMDDNVAVPLICDFLVNCDEEIERFLRNENDFDFVAIAGV